MSLRFIFNRFDCLTVNKTKDGVSKIGFSHNYLARVRRGTKDCADAGNCLNLLHDVNWKSTAHQHNKGVRGAYGKGVFGTEFLQPGVIGRDPRQLGCSFIHRNSDLDTRDCREYCSEDVVTCLHSEIRSSNKDLVLLFLGHVNCFKLKLGHVVEDRRRQEKSSLQSRQKFMAINFISIGDVGTDMRLVVVAIASILLVPSVFSVTEMHDRIGLLLLGDVGRLGSPIDDWLDQDLIIDYFEIPMAQTALSEHDLKRYTAIYFPRTMSRLLSLYNMVVICEEEGLFSKYFTAKQKMMLYNAVEKEGVALFNSLPNEDFEEKEWADCILSNLMPHDYRSYKVYKGGFSISVVKRKDLPPIFTPFVPLGIEKYHGPWCRRINPRTGSTIWATVKPFGTPFFVGWEVGEKKARTSNVANDLDEPWWGSAYRGAPSQNPYGGDLFLNIVYWSVGKKPITNINIVHTIRAVFGDFLLQQEVTASLIDFVDSFGANTRSLSKDLDEISKGRKEARELYFEQRYDETLSFLQKMKERMKEVNTRAVKLKQRAFLWIYLVEWLVVTGALMVMGFITWSLLVRRRLYKEVRTTRTA